MNKFIKEELNKVKIPLPSYNDSTTCLVIPRMGEQRQINSDVVVGGLYLIHIEDYIIHEPETFTLSTNWNKGTKPDDTRLYAQVVSINGKMIAVKTKAVNTGTLWAGWLPRKGFTIIDELDNNLQAK